MVKRGGGDAAPEDEAGRRWTLSGRVSGGAWPPYSVSYDGTVGLVGSVLSGGGPPYGAYALPFAEDPFASSPARACSTRCIAALYARACFSSAAVGNLWETDAECPSCEAPCPCEEPPCPCNETLCPSCEPPWPSCDPPPYGGVPVLPPGMGGGVWLGLDEPYIDSRPIAANPAA